MTWMNADLKQRRDYAWILSSCRCNSAMRAPRACATNDAKPARARERSAHCHDRAALRDYRLPLQRQWFAVAVCVGPMDERLNESFLERPTTGGVKQSGSVRAERHTPGDPRNANTS